MCSFSLQKQLIKEVKMVKRHKEICLILLVIKEIQIKIILSYHDNYVIGKGKKDSL